MVEGTVCGWTVHIVVLGHATDSCNLICNLALWQHATMSWLGTLGQLHFDHFDIWQSGPFRKLLRVEFAVDSSATKISCANIPDEVAARLQVPIADGAFPGVVVEISMGCAFVQCENRVGGECPVAHGTDVQARCRVGLPTTLGPYCETQGFLCDNL